MINITVIGFGNVGSSLSLLLLNNRHSLRLNIMEPDKQCEGAFLDLLHGISLYPEKELEINNEELFENADFVFFTAGTPNVPGGSRLSTAKQNVQLSKDIFEGRGFVNNPYIIVITNPVDIVSHAVYKFSGLPAEKIIGTGTYLDSIRLEYYLSTLSSYTVNNLKGFVLGEHGSSQVPIYSMTEVNGQPILNNTQYSKKQLDLAAHLTKNAANQIRETQSGTTYGVSKCAEVLLNYLLGEDEQLIALSMLTNDHYRTLLNLGRDIYISLPVAIDKGKIKIIDSIDITSEELDAYRNSAAIIAEVLG